MKIAIGKKVDNWLDPTKGLKTRFSDRLQDPPVDRVDVGKAVLDEKIDRGDTLQELRLKHYPSIDVNKRELFAGKIQSDLEMAEEMLNIMGYRNNPTAYVEITEEHGPDDGSYARQIVTESGTNIDNPKLSSFPSPFRREKRQIHVTIYGVEDGTIFLAHEERSAWLQPGRHIAINDASGRRGVRDFRDDWFDEFGQELGGKEEVKWNTTN
jgi:hypothetical protein